MTTALITGANRGIGLELCRQLAERGDTVIAACRSTSPVLAALSVRVIENVDVQFDDSVQRMADTLAGTQLDILINNAGILAFDNLDNLDFDEMRRQYEVNTLGPLRVIRALLPLLGKGSKILIMSSRVGSIADNGSSGNYGYRASKVAVNMIGVNLSLDLRDRGIAVGLLHPGLVATDMTHGTGIPASHAASGLIARVDELTLENSGRFWHAEGEELPW